MPKKITSDLEGVATLLESRRPAPGGSYRLCVRNKKIMITVGRYLKPGSTPLAVLLATDINEGPVPKLWEVINARIRRLKEEGKL